MLCFTKKKKKTKHKQTPNRNLDEPNKEAKFLPATTKKFGKLQYCVYIDKLIQHSIEHFAAIVFIVFFPHHI